MCKKQVKEKVVTEDCIYIYMNTMEFGLRKKIQIPWIKIMWQNVEC
jgi:hypothetical protein